MISQPDADGFDRTETVGHCRRVCALSLRTSAILRFSEKVREPLGIAASLHQFCRPGFQRGSLAGIFEDLPGLIPAGSVLNNGVLNDAVPNNAVLNNDALNATEEILISLGNPRISLSREIQVAAEVVRACDLLDEAVEFGVVEGLAPAEAITKFHEDMDDCFTPGLRDALRQVTSGTSFALSRAALPVMPKAAARMMRTSDETSPRELEQIASLDPALAGRLLEIANSARFGPEQPIMRLAEAAARVGVPLARKILYGACFGRLFASKTLRHLWQKSQVVAALASAGAKLADQDPEVAYAAGLLHDIGRIVFESADARSRVSVADWAGRGFPPTYAEALTYATDHAGTGAELLREWGLPETIVEAVGNHHQPERTGSPLASLLFLAEQWHAEKWGPGESGETRDFFQRMRRAHAACLVGIPPEYPGSQDLEFEVLAHAS